MPHTHRFAHAPALLLSAVVLLGGMVAAFAQQQPPVNAPTATARILFTAVDKNKNSVTTLRKEDVRVLEDGAPQEIISFERQTGQPLTLALMLDTSISQERLLPVAKEVARVFIDSLIRPGKDEVAVISFTGELTLEQGLTGDIERIREAIDRVKFVKPPGHVTGGVIVTGPLPINPNLAGSTAMWDTLHKTAEEVFQPDSGNTRRAVIMISDGVDTSSEIKMDKAIDRVAAANIAVYTIGIGDDINYDGVEKTPLTKLSERTGARAFFPKNRDDLPEVFKQIEQELRTQYFITYAPPATKKGGDALRKVKIEIVNPELRKQKLHLAYRQGYHTKGN